MLRNFDILGIILSIPAILLGFTLHEYAHALVADRLGDKTPRFQGRLTLNPIAHVDPVGFLMILLLGFGWAKPVQVNPYAFKNRYKDDLKVSLAGPLANLFLAVFSALVLSLVIFMSKFYVGGRLVSVLIAIIKPILTINCMLFFLNLMPIPGFDGFHILRDIFPKEFNKYSETINRYQNIILIIFIVSPLSSYLVGNPARALAQGLINLSFKLTGM
ncbi:site-2 protease family protein [Clostridium algidicarnis]|uniref:site-2 protease family protein n=1 Tax=Clostridium algidicarnis TaxID=37659 RepID=UPI001C0E3576|nr:site-2 protease family protein [Clostridium algidicarnis]MBU3203622.1 site-2 protease family protein [Clostridium algidicarnis]MBU3206093.1 site-2 protease family protein [Clostridium algidicarnis]MBU3211776.1 site-2 protease family protein [Clostridium algidicarnis]MBU3221717.1 site-2 protease family protein [Clostridium algidicarnis]